MFIPTIHVNIKDEIDIEEQFNESLLMSLFPIHEYEPVFVPKYVVQNITDEYSNEIEINHQYRYFLYTINEQQEQRAPKALVFQGSYMNGIESSF